MSSLQPPFLPSGALPPTAYGNFDATAVPPSRNSLDAAAAAALSVGMPGIFSPGVWQQPAMPHFFAGTAAGTHGMGAAAAAEEQPVFVNARQYHRIIKRREARKKRFGDDALTQSRALSRKKAYLHESRHKHAMKRQRGAGGRFLSRKERAKEAGTTVGGSSGL